MTVLIDTLKLARSRAESGMDRKQAEALSKGLTNSFKGSDVATKVDIEKLRLEVRAEISSSRNQIILAMVGMLGLGLTLARFQFG
jgi:hypothetical protein